MEGDCAHNDSKILSQTTKYTQTLTQDTPAMLKKLQQVNTSPAPPALSSSSRSKRREKSSKVTTSTSTLTTSSSTSYNEMYLQSILASQTALQEQISHHEQVIKLQLSTISRLELELKHVQSESKFDKTTHSTYKVRSDIIKKQYEQKETELKNLIGKIKSELDGVHMSNSELKEQQKLIFALVGTLSCHVKEKKQVDGDKKKKKKRRTLKQVVHDVVDAVKGDSDNDKEEAEKKETEDAEATTPKKKSDGHDSSDSDSSSDEEEEEEKAESTEVQEEEIIVTLETYEQCNELLSLIETKLLKLQTESEEKNIRIEELIIQVESYKSEIHMLQRAISVNQITVKQLEDENDVLKGSLTRFEASDLQLKKHTMTLERNLKQVKDKLAVKSTEAEQLQIYLDELVDHDTHYEDDSTSEQTEYTYETKEEEDFSVKICEIVKNVIEEEVEKKKVTSIEVKITDMVTLVLREVNESEKIEVEKEFEEEFVSRMIETSIETHKTLLEQKIYSSSSIQLNSMSEVDSYSVSRVFSDSMISTFESVYSPDDHTIEDEDKREEVIIKTFGEVFKLQSDSSLNSDIVEYRKEYLNEKLKEKIDEYKEDESIHKHKDLLASIFAEVSQTEELKSEEAKDKVEQSIKKMNHKKKQKEKFAEMKQAVADLTEIAKVFEEVKVEISEQQEEKKKKSKKSIEQVVSQLKGIVEYIKKIGDLYGHNNSPTAEIQQIYEFHRHLQTILNTEDTSYSKTQHRIEHIIKEDDSLRSVISLVHKKIEETKRDGQYLAFEVSHKNKKAEQYPHYIDSKLQRISSKKDASATEQMSSLSYTLLKLFKNSMEQLNQEKHDNDLLESELEENSIQLDTALQENEKLKLEVISLKSRLALLSTQSKLEFKSE
jgi:hypothetical protein